MPYLTENQVRQLTTGMGSLTETIHRAWYEDEWTEERADMHQITRLVNRGIEKIQNERNERLQRFAQNRLNTILAACTDHPSAQVIADVISEFNDLCTE